MNGVTLQFISSEFEKAFFGSERVNFQRNLKAGTAIYIIQCIILTVIALKNGQNFPQGYITPIQFLCLACISWCLHYFKNCREWIFNTLLLLKSTTACFILVVFFLYDINNFKSSGIYEPLVGFLLAFDIIFSLQGTNFLIKSIICFLNLASYSIAFFYGNTSIGFVCAWCCGSVLFLIKVYFLDKQKRELFIEKQCSAELSNFVERILPTGVVITKYKPKEERSYLHSSNKRANSTFGIINDDSFKNFAKKVIVSSSYSSKFTEVVNSNDSGDELSQKESMKPSKKKSTTQQSLFLLIENLAKKQFQKQSQKKADIPKSSHQLDKLQQSFRQSSQVLQVLQTHTNQMPQQPKAIHLPQKRNVNKGVSLRQEGLFRGNSKFKESTPVSHSNVNFVPSLGILRETELSESNIVAKGKRKLSKEGENENSNKMLQYNSRSSIAYKSQSIENLDKLESFDKQLMSTDRPVRRTNKRAATVKLDLSRIGSPRDNKPSQNRKNYKDVFFNSQDPLPRKNSNSNFVPKPSRIPNTRKGSIFSLPQQNNVQPEKPQQNVEQVQPKLSFEEVQEKPQKRIKVQSEQEYNDMIERVIAVYTDSEGRTKNLRISVYGFQANEQFQIILIEDETLDGQVKTQIDTIKQITKMFSEAISATRLPLTHTLHSIQQASESYKKLEEEILFLQNTVKELNNRLMSQKANKDNSVYVNNNNDIRSLEFPIDSLGQDFSGSESAQVLGNKFPGASSLNPLLNVGASGSNNMQINLGNMLGINLININTINMQDLNIINSKFDMYSSMSALPSAVISDSSLQANNIPNSRGNERNSVVNNNFLSVDFPYHNNDQNMISNHQNMLQYKENELPAGEQLEEYLKTGKYFGFIALNGLYNHIDYFNIMNKKQLDIRVSEISMKKVLNQIINVLDYVTKKKRIQIAIINDSTQDIMRTDERRLKQILLNILSQVVDKVNNGYIGLKVSDAKQNQFPGIKITILSSRSYMMSTRDLQSHYHSETKVHDSTSFKKRILKTVNTSIIGKLGPYALLNSNRSNNNDNTHTLSFLLYIDLNILNKFQSLSYNYNSASQSVNNLSVGLNSFNLNQNQQEENIQSEGSSLNMSYALNKLIIDNSTANNRFRQQSHFYQNEFVDLDNPNNSNQFKNHKSKVVKGGNSVFESSSFSQQNMMSANNNSNNVNNHNFNNTIQQVQNNSNLVTMSQINNGVLASSSSASSYTNNNNNNINSNNSYLNSNLIFQPNNSNTHGSVEKAPPEASRQRTASAKSTDLSLSPAQPQHRFDQRHKQRSIASKISEQQTVENDEKQTRGNSISQYKVESKEYSSLKQAIYSKKSKAPNSNDHDTEENLSSVRRRGETSIPTSSKEVISFFSNAPLKQIGNNS